MFVILRFIVGCKSTAKSSIIFGRRKIDHPSIHGKWTKPNMSSVSVCFIFFSIKLPILGLILSMYIIGSITGWAVKRNDVKKMINSVQDQTKKDIRQLQKQIRK